METARAQDFLELMERAKRGRLKLYLGFAAGVGKTYRMLEEAHALKKRGIDVVIGFIETHGRPETAALTAGLEHVPTRKIEYRGLTIEEMDVDAVIARTPQVALVDEIAHTNPPGCRNGKRYQDVYQILDAGINVICAFNVQHLESLKDVVQRVTGVVIRETVPDTFVKQADQVINIDLAIEDLVDRLRSGKIYNEEKVTWALEHFFRDNNLLTLRELALREVAESVDRVAVASQQMADKPRRRANSRVMVCMASSSPNAGGLLRRGSRLAGRLNTDWFAVYVETPNEAPHLIDSEAQRRLIANIEKARELGAEVVRLHGKNPVHTLIDFARSHDVGYVMIGRSRSHGLRYWTRRSVMYEFVAEAEGLDLHIVSFEEEAEE
ncbi:MAG TPA: sensor histidine kinase KdpD [Pirellulales bacterium]|jgi:two-component system sensor histidine kinase KdpD|nr:sensor histidine kinase KdpD [Pirellulales bacterium]